METINKSMFVFQTDSDIVRNVYDTQHNYLIEYNEQCKDKTYCAVYFCSNDLYYPNVEDIFRAAHRRSDTHTPRPSRETAPYNIDNTPSPPRLSAAKNCRGCPDLSETAPQAAL